MAKESVEDILEHFGVKGMRWGVRRRVGSDGTVTGKRSKPKPSTDFKTTAPLRNRPSHTLTNLQLKKVNERMNLEKKYSQMNPTKLDKGKSYIDDVLKSSIGTGLGAVAIVKIAQNEKAQEFAKKGWEAVRLATRRGKHFA